MNICINKYETFLLGGGLDVSFAWGIKEFLSTDQHIADVYIRAMQLYGIELHKMVCETNPKDFLISAIKSEKNIMILLDTSKLSYNKVFTRNEATGHFVNVIGYRNNQVYISDGYVPTRVLSIFEGWISIEALLDIWSVYGYYYIEIAITDIEEVNKIISNQNMISTIKLDLQHYLNGGVDNNTGLYHGISAIHNFQRYLEYVLKHEGKELEKFLYRLVYNFKIKGFFIGKNCIYNLIINIFPDDNVIEKEMQENIRNWNITMLKILKIRFEPSNEYIGRLKNIICVLIEKEINTYRKIIDRM